MKAKEIAYAVRQTTVGINRLKPSVVLSRLVPATSVAIAAIRNKYAMDRHLSVGGAQRLAGDSPRPTTPLVALASSRLPFSIRRTTRCRHARCHANMSYTGDTWTASSRFIARPLFLVGDRGCVQLEHGGDRVGQHPHCGWLSIPTGGLRTTSTSDVLPSTIAASTEDPAANRQNRVEPARCCFSLSQSISAIRFPDRGQGSHRTRLSTRDIRSVGPGERGPCHTHVLPDRVR
jgi:hypothetical protein